jgi:hypothetical protein
MNTTVFILQHTCHLLVGQSNVAFSSNYNEINLRRGSRIWRCLEILGFQINKIKL